MPRYLVDEDLPRSLAASLRALGHDATDVREEGLRGQADARIFEFAQQRGFVVLTADVEFANELVYPPAGHRGVMLVRLPGSLLAPTLIQAVVAAVASLSSEDLVATIVIVEAGRIRIRRATQA